MNYLSEDEEKVRLRDWLIRFASRFEMGFIVTDPADDDAIVFVNKAFTNITGYTFEEVQGRNLRFLHGEGTDLSLIQKIDRQLQNGHPVIEELQQYKKDGTPFWSELVIQPLLNEEGKVLFNTSFVIDVSTRKKNESILKLHERMFIGVNEGKSLGDLLQVVWEAISAFIPHGGGGAYLCEKEENEWTVLKSTALPDSLIKGIENKVDFDPTFSQYNTVFINELPPSHEHDYVEVWALPIFSLDGKVTELFTVFVKEKHLLTEELVEYFKKLLPTIQMTKTFFEQKRQLEWLAYSDSTTDLPNRHSMIHILNKKNDENINYFVAAIQPAEYITIIDLYGRDEADNLFVQLAKRIKKLGRGKDSIVGRVSSDSLAFINDLKDSKEVDDFAYRLRSITAEPFKVAGREMFITLKAGFALSTEDFDADEMLRRADAALTNANGKNGLAISFYKDLRNEEAVKEMTIVNELFKAIATNEINIHLQPKVQLTTGEIIGFEALARWYSKELGHVPPNDFIPLAERVGKIIDLEKVIFKQVFNWLSNRQRSGKKMYQVAVNVSVDHFFHTSFVRMLQRLSAEYEIAPRYLRLEMTESIGLVDFTNAKHVFRELHDAGFEVSIDDFGVGYSSLSYLPQLQVSELKIDRSFINAISDQDTHAVVTTIIQLASNLKLATVAEGIEEAYQVDALLALGCKIGQGYYFHKPMPLDEVDLLLE
ncbi:putative bifunctional diguanylate cyclase/phosphodiesterase [Sporosarcina ureilytica]|uniref:GGDEF domain-containing protein n=1 Tax=Sporosarcina ureilytica TaxID=298596 RepID=A0A1D8JJF0_9BACL|nr:bifunctional diguanylate cyclase/phosphodiesterase [Sporosarcina ureilytica]AOV08835.1 hypothetical protein BI350_15620 [Sporosarcina ureilytica]